MKRSEKMFKNLGLRPPLVTIDNKAAAASSTSNKAPSEVSEFTASELNFLSPWLPTSSSMQKCRSWLEKSTTNLEETVSNSVSLVDYSPSSASTLSTRNTASNVVQSINPMCKRKLDMFSELQKVSTSIDPAPEPFQQKQSTTAASSILGDNSSKGSRFLRDRKSAKRYAPSAHSDDNPDDEYDFHSDATMDEWKPRSRSSSPSSLGDKSINSRLDSSHHSEGIEMDARTASRQESSQQELSGSDEDAGSDNGTVRKKSSREIKQERTYNRNHGKEYISGSGKKVLARERRPVHSCNVRRCQDIITNDVGETIFHEYWEQGSHDKRVSYIASRVEVEPVKRKRRRMDGANRDKHVTYKYFFDIGGVRHRVCKQTFLGTLGETDTFLRECSKNKGSAMSGVTRNDRRGKKKPAHCLKEEAKNEVTEHIKSFPAYVSHYCRKQTKQKYLSSSLCLQKMYDLYKASCCHNVSYSTYRRIFKTMKLKFKPPASDTCSICDELKMKIKCEADDTARKELETSYELHLRKAEAAYNMKREMKELAKNDETVRVIIFDLEQCLPTPHISTSSVYYLRQLYTYNLTAYDSTTKITHCYMWHEGEGARGANEIASCLFQHIMEQVPSAVKKLYLFSDACSGQNRNSHVSAMFHVALQRHPSVTSIEHIFLVRGHTRLECDSKHSVIERSKSAVEKIEVPSEWYTLVQNAGKANTFLVTEMKDKFFAFSDLLLPTGPLIMRDKMESGRKFYWSKTHVFQYSKGKAGIISVKANFNGEPEEYDMVRGNGKNRKLSRDWFKSLRKISSIHPITEQKKKDVISLLHFINPVHHQFYKDLPTVASPADTPMEDDDPDLPSDNDGDYL